MEKALVQFLGYTIKTTYSGEIWTAIIENAFQECVSICYGLTESKVLCVSRLQILKTICDIQPGSAILVQASLGVILHANYDARKSLGLYSDQHRLHQVFPQLNTAPLREEGNGYVGRIWVDSFKYLIDPDILFCLLEFPR